MDSTHTLRYKNKIYYPEKIHYNVVILNNLNHESKCTGCGVSISNSIASIYWFPRQHVRGVHKGVYLS